MNSICSRRVMLTTLAHDQPVSMGTRSAVFVGTDGKTPVEFPIGPVEGRCWVRLRDGQCARARTDVPDALILTHLHLSPGVLRKPRQGCPI